MDQLQSVRQRVGNLTIATHFSPPQNRSVIHFLHGTGFSSQTYLPFLKGLSDDFDLFLQDVQGHGESASDARFVGWNGTAEYALKVMDAHQPYFEGRPVLGVAHSFGAVVTLLMAARNPERFRGLVLLEPVLFPKRRLTFFTCMGMLGLLSQNPLARQARRRTREWANRTAAEAYFHERGIFKGWSKPALHAYLDFALRSTEGGGLALKCQPEFEAQIFSSFPRQLWKSVRRLSVPTVIVRGTTGYPVLAETFPLASAANPKITSHTLEGGHCFMQERPQEVAAWVKAKCHQLIGS